jgi:hypothetical protein
MSASRRIQAKRVAAELSSVDSVLSTIDANDYFGRLSLEGRKTQLQEQLSDSIASAEETSASAALFFGGAPVFGNIGVESGFGGMAISKFQDLVAKLLIDDREGLGQRGPLPAHEDAKLHITGVMRGSFGFLLEEIDQEASLWDTPLKAAVTKATRLLEAFADQNEEAFEQILEVTDQRSLATANDFFSLLASNHATLRLVTGAEEMQVDTAAVERATKRGLTSTVEEHEEEQLGVLSGLLPQTHMFELLGHTGGVISGRVSRTISTETLSGMLAGMLNQPVIASLKVREVLRDGVIARRSYTLISLTEDEPRREYIGRF